MQEPKESRGLESPKENPGFKTLYEVTGRISDINTVLVSRQSHESLIKANKALLDDFQLIAETDPVDAALDPQRAVRIAQNAINPNTGFG